MPDEHKLVLHPLHFEGTGLGKRGHGQRAMSHGLVVLVDLHIAAYKTATIVHIPDLRADHSRQLDLKGLHHAGLVDEAATPPVGAVVTGHDAIGIARRHPRDGGAHIEIGE